MTRTALVTGGNRGIGLEICRQLAKQGLDVVLGSRDPDLGEEAAAGLRESGIEVRVERIDVADDDSVRNCASRLALDEVHVDVLVNNAGTYPPGDLPDLETEILRDSLEVNLLGALRTCREFGDGMIDRGYGRIVQLSSGYGAFAEGLEGPAAYSIAKAALNAFTLKLSKAVSGDVKVNACCPGWVRTRMGGPDADVSPEEGADTAVWLATLPADGPNGGFFRRRQRIDW